MTRFISLLPLLLITAVASAQIQSPACNYDYGGTIQNAGGLIQWTTASCPDGQPNAIGAVPFPTGTPTTLSPWMNIVGPGQGYPGDIAPLQDQPNLYVVCGKDDLGHSIADFSLGNTGATEFGGLHVGWYTPQGTFGNELEINVVDSLMLKELWVVEGATVDINGPVYITRECHNAGTININEGGSLNFLVDRTLHNHALLENRGTINGRVSWEALYLDGPVVNSWGHIADYLPQSLQDSIDPYVSYMTYDEWLEFYADNYATFTENIDANNPSNTLYGVSYSGYHLFGLPLSGIRLNPLDGDVKQKSRFKGFQNNAGGFYWAGPLEDLANSILPGSSYTIVAIPEDQTNLNNPDTIFFDANSMSAEEWDIDTTLWQNGVFESISIYYNGDLQELNQQTFEEADNLTWVDWEGAEYYAGFWPGSFKTILAWNDMRIHSSLGNPIWIDPEHSIMEDSTGLNPFNIHTGNVRPLMVEELAEYYPPGHRQRIAPIPSTADPGQKYVYAQFTSFDSNTPIHVPMGVFVAMAGSQRTPIIWEYTGYPWLNSSTANEGQTYPALPYENQSIPIFQNEVDNEVRISLAYAPGIEYFYNLDGNLFSVDEFDECLESNDSLYCFENGYVYELGEIAAVSPIIVESVEGSLAANGTVNDWTNITNVTGGYLDLDALTERILNENPDLDHVDYAWYSVSVSSGGTYVENPTYINPAIQGLSKRFFRRKYHRYQGSIYSSELDYWITLLAEYAQANPYIQNDLIQTFITDWQTDSIINSDVAINYITTDTLTPFSYYELGKYMQPSSSLWIKVPSPTGIDIHIGPDEAIYDFDFPQEVPGYEIGGDYFLNNQRVVQDSAAHSIVLAVDFKNDTIYWPVTFFSHAFDEDGENGLQQYEDDDAISTYHPFLYGDSTSFHAYTYAVEESPHNNEPLLGMIPEPDSAFVITPLVLQEIAEFDGPPKRVAFRTHSKGDTVIYANGDTIIFTDQVGPITYLAEGDTMWFRKRDFKYPVTVEVYFTNMIGDFTGDGYVGGADFLDFFSAYEDCATDNPVNPELQTYDLDEDGCVGVSDYLTMVGFYGHTMFVENSFGTQPLIEEPIDAQLVADNYNNLRNDPNVAIAGQTIRIAGETIKLYDRSHNLIQERRNEVTAPLQDVYIIVTDRRVGMIDFRL